MTIHLNHVDSTGVGVNKDATSGCGALVYRGDLHLQYHPLTVFDFLRNVECRGAHPGP
jgi:hypothetical protein